MEKSRTREQIFEQMHREMRIWNPEVSESPERLDPILKIMLSLYAHQLERIDRRIDHTWDNTVSSLIRALCPESRRWPIPAHTVIRCKPRDPVVEIDPHSRFFYKEKREDGHTFFFSALRHEKLVAAETKHMFLLVDHELFDLSPKDKVKESDAYAEPPKIPAGAQARFYLAVDFTGNPAEFVDSVLFINGLPDAVRQLRWGHWYPGTNFGEFYTDISFCPGLDCNIEEIFYKDGKPINWGGLRSSGDVFSTLNDNFIVLPESFAATWELGPPDHKLADKLAQKSIVLEEGDRFYWIRIDLPAGGTRSSLTGLTGVYFDAFLAVNKSEMKLFKHTGGNKILEIEIPENIDNIVDIVEVTDARGNGYIPSYEVRTDPNQRVYSVEEENGRLVLWFDFSTRLEPVPDNITVVYSTTAGTRANGIDAGLINELYESHPGIVTAENITMSAGAIPAKSPEQIMLEVSNRLRGRDRAISFQDVANWAMTYDRRIKKAACRSGVKKGAFGVFRCIKVAVTVSKDDFYSDDELRLLKVRLEMFLKSCSSVNTQYDVEITA
jgi:hypothetical protein